MHDLVLGFGVELVRDLAHDLFQNVLERDETLKRAVFVHHQREMRVQPQELAHLVVQRRGLGDEVGLHGDLVQVEVAQRLGRGAVRLDRQLVHGAQQILGVDDAHDVLGVVAIDGQAGVIALEALRQDVLGRVLCIDHLDPRPVQHDLLDRAVAQVQRAQDAVAVLLLDHALGMAQVQGARDLVPHGQDIGAGVGLDAEHPQDQPHQGADGGHDRREDGDDDLDRRGDQGRGGFRVGDGVGLWQHLGKDQDQHGHDQRGQGDPAVPEQPREKRGRQRRGQDVDQVVAQKDRPDQAFVVLGDLQRPFGGARSLVGLGAQLAARRGRQRGFGSREEGRHDQQQQDGPPGDPEGKVEKAGGVVHRAGSSFGWRVGVSALWRRGGSGSRPGPDGSDRR